MKEVIYQNLLEDVLFNGVEKSDRTGTGTISVFGRQIRHDMKQGFPLLTTKKMYWKGIVTELLWFLRGDTNIKFLHDNNCHIWDGDYEKSGRTDGELGPVYGRQWRSWKGYSNEDWDAPNTDQITNLINNIKLNPDSRRLMVNAWNVGELDQMTLPPCHYGFQVWTRELSEIERFEISLKSGDTPKGWGTISWVRDKEWNPNNETVIEVMNRLNIPKREISLMWNQRSVDTFLGLPFNIASYGLLLEILANEVNMVPGELVGNLGDVHLYTNHLDQAREQLMRYPKQLSKLIINNEFWNPDQGTIEQINYITPDDFYIKDYQSHSTIKAPLSN